MRSRRRSSWRRRGPASSSRPRCAVSKRLATASRLLGELRPTGPGSRPSALEDLVRRPVEQSNGVDRLADHAEHREQGERRAEHDLLAQREVGQARVALVDEPVDRTRWG